MARSDRSWILEGAAVRESFVGFDNGSEAVHTLDGRAVSGINADLTSALDLTRAHRLHENLQLSYMGGTKGGPFDLTPEQAIQMLAAPVNPNGRTNCDVIRPWFTGVDVTRRPRGRYIIDFGTDMTEDQASLYELPFEYLHEHVLPTRKTNNRAAYRDRWWLFMEPRPAFRRASAPLSRFIATSMVSKHRIFTWLDSSSWPENLLILVTREDDYFFGVLPSKPHEIWALRMGSWLGVGNDPRYTPSTTFETFPFPWPPGSEPAEDPRLQAIANGAEKLVTKRDRWLNPEGATETDLKTRTLTNLYNQSPTWL